MTDETVNHEAIRADMEAGTLGPWKWTGGSAFSVRQANGPYVAGIHMWDVTSKAEADCRRIARLPDLEQAYLDMRARAEAAEAVAEQAKTLYRETLNRAVAAEAKRDEAVAALTSLERRATRVSDKGASTGSQWTQLTIGLLAARTVLERIPSPDTAALTDTQEGRDDGAL